MMEHQRSSQQSTLASSSLTLRHVCSRCGKLRSKKYHNHYPLLPGQIPEPGICSRPKCATAVDDILHSPCQVIVYETHYHYHSNSEQEGPPPSYTAGELGMFGGSLRGLSPIERESPSPVETSSGPGELSGESSPTGQVELPDNVCSRRRTFGRLSPILEESPPPVNLLNKPTLQKKKLKVSEN